MLSFNRTWMTTMLCLLAMLLTSTASSARASAAPIESGLNHDLQFAFQKQMSVENTDCDESHHAAHQVDKGQQAHTSCSSSCIVKMPTNLSQDDLMLLPHRLALIDKLPTPKAVVVIYQPYRPPIV
ncbi:hypothetical protein SO574_15655 [Vibrio alfacsensis]|uniref:hypothetical protein n=1 Tax=Vibrio alfacsensis TaxID=1074311 RepID=UPI002ADDB220|nr:hypothetical protein [Vibrio alfacsensis]WQE78580.1 hypothetical protein SO574_15655 [Vibrio alfacsensis]